MSKRRVSRYYITINKNWIQNIIYFINYTNIRSYETGKKLDMHKLEILDFRRAHKQLKTNNICQPMVKLLKAIF